jgi:ABC-type bacteriocin/lantibiotic exporter with double-glycine peptidase domain
MAELAGTVKTGQEIADDLKNWVMVALTLIFVLLYGAALIGWIKPLTDVTLVTRLEPIIFVIIGYYFGRLPAQQNEKTLKEEINRQTQRVDAAQHAKEQVQQAREALEEKVKNVEAVLVTASPGASFKGLVDHHDKVGGPVKEDALRYSVAAAINILNS